MEQAFVTFWWLVAIILAIRWLKGMKTRSVRSGRAFSNRMEWQ